MSEKTAEVRRQHILDAARRVFGQRGYHRATIRDIAREAGVSDGTIYNSFDGKAALLLALLDPLDELQARSQATPEPIPHDVRQFLVLLLRRRWEALDPARLETMRAILSEALVDPELRALYVERVIEPTLALPEPYFASLVAEGRLAPVDVRFTLRAIAATFMGLVMLRLMGDAHLDREWDLVPERLSSLWLDGLLPSAPERPRGQ